MSDTARQSIGSGDQIGADANSCDGTGADTDADLPGEWLLAGRYRMDALLGVGGMSQVWHGYDERLDRRVAVKVMLPTAPAATVPGSAEARQIAEDIERDRQRFLREIRTTARLEHPGIPAVYDTGVDGRTERIFLVMQLLVGRTLRDLITARRRSGEPAAVSWASAVAAQVAATLADVHRVDVVHRDIKPENVMLVDGGLVKVLDFGIAILKGAGALPRLTQFDRTVGTPPYMSPEQLLDRPVGAPSDVYSLGCLLFELLTGQLPYPESLDRSFREQHLFAPIPSPRARRADVPHAIDDLVHAMLAKNAADRPDAESVYEALLPFAADPSPSPKGRRDGRDSGVESSPDPTLPFRRPLGARIGVAHAPRREHESAEPPLTEHEAQDLIARAEQLAEDDQPHGAIDLLRAGVQRATHDPIMALQLQHALASALFYADEYTQAAPLYDEVAEQFAQELSEDAPMVAECRYYAGFCYAEIGESAKAIARLRFYVAHATRDNLVGIEQHRDALYLIATMLAATGRVDEAREQFEAVRAIYVDAYGAASTHVRQLDRQIRHLGEFPNRR